MQCACRRLLGDARRLQVRLRACGDDPRIRIPWEFGYKPGSKLQQDRGGLPHGRLDSAYSQAGIARHLAHTGKRSGPEADAGQTRTCSTTLAQQRSRPQAPAATRDDDALPERYFHFRCFDSLAEALLKRENRGAIAAVLAERVELERTRAPLSSDSSSPCATAGSVTPCSPPQSLTPTPE